MADRPGLSSYPLSGLRTLNYVPLVDVGLFLERAEILRSSRAAATIDETALHLEIIPPDSPRVELHVPDDEATTAFFARIRDFGTPGKMIYVAKYIDVLGETAAGRRATVVEHLRESMRDLGVVSHEWHKLVPGAATPRDVWELWTYGYILHTDEAKRARWAGMNSIQQGMAQYVAYAYAAGLFHLVTVVEAMLRDPAIDDRHVHIQILAPRPDFPVPDELRGFRAARVRLRDPEAP